MDLGASRATCGKCGHEFAFGLQSPRREVPRAAQPQPKSEPLLPQSRRFKIERSGGQWTIRWRSWSPVHVFLAFFCTFWDGFLIFWYYLAFTEDGPLMMKVFPLLHVMVGVVLTYVVITSFLNRTIVHVSRDELVIRHGPLPWWGNRRLKVREIQQLYCNRSSMEQNSQWIYQLSAIMRDGRKLKLLSGFTDPDEPRYLEKILEERMNIAPQPVSGEIGP